MTDYDIALLWALILLISSLLTGFAAVTNNRSVSVALVLFVIGGLLLYYASSINGNGNLAEDIPKVFYRLYARIMG